MTGLGGAGRATRGNSGMNNTTLIKDVYALLLWPTSLNLWSSSDILNLQKLSFITWVVIVDPGQISWDKDSHDQYSQTLYNYLFVKKDLKKI